MGKIFALRQEALGNFRDLGASIQRLCTLAADGRVSNLVDEEIALLPTVDSSPDTVAKI